MSGAASGECCANCAATLHGPYCHACGQKGRPARSLRLLMEEAAGNLAHLDNRLLRTLPLLLFRPGRLSRHWSQGRHAPYVSPLAAFLFSAFVLFTVIALTGARIVEPDQVRSFAAMGSKYLGVDARVTQDPAVYVPKIQEAASRLALLVVPVTLGLVMLLMAFRRGFNVYDHAVVALYGLSGFGLIVAAQVVIAVNTPDLWLPLDAAVSLLPLGAHALFLFKGAYGLGWIGAGVRTALLAGLMILAFLAYTVLVSVVAVMG